MKHPVHHRTKHISVRKSLILNETSVRLNISGHLHAPFSFGLVAKELEQKAGRLLNLQRLCYATGVPAIGK
jgi:hypothetical protein